MVKQMIKFLRLILVMSLALFSVNAVAELKVGYVNVEKILKDAPQTAETGKKLEKEFSQRAAELTRLEKQIEKQISEQKNSDTAKGRELASLRLEFERKQRELKEDINIRKKEELSAFQNRINKAVAVVSEAEGYELVMYGGIAYGSKRVDLTDKVIKLLGKPTP